MTGKTVDIIGAGIAGLTAALAFSRLGWTVRLREQAAELREVGAGLQLSPNATRILLALGLGERLAPSLHKPGRIALASGISLDTIAYVPAGAEAEKRWKAPYGVIHRADLQTVLFEAAEVFSFCSAALSRKVMEADVMNIGFCPYDIFVMQLPESEEVTIGYRAFPDGAMQEVQSLLDQIVKEAIGE